MTYDVDKPTRLNTEITRENFYKYRTDNEVHKFVYRWMLVRGPDSDVVWKTKQGLVNGAAAAVVSSAYNIYSLENAHLGWAAKSFMHSVPCIAGGLTYGVTVGILSHVRGEENVAHHMAGGAAAGTIIGSWYQKPKLSYGLTAFLAVFSGVVRHMYDEGVFDLNPFGKEAQPK